MNWEVEGGSNDRCPHGGHLAAHMAFSLQPNGKQEMFYLTKYSASNRFYS